MNRKQLVENVADTTGLSSEAAEQALAATLDAIVGAVAGGEAVALPGFGTFERRSRAARTGRNPQTGEPLAIAAGHFPAFKPAAPFKRQVNEA